jgi:hypothetical protein
MAKMRFEGRGFRPGYPRVGDLIRSKRSGRYINIVLEVSEEMSEKGIHEGFRFFRAIRSVRYGDTNLGNFKLLNGTRSRSFKWSRDEEFTWEIVDQLEAKTELVEVTKYVKVDNLAERMNRVKELDGVDTTYRQQGQL